jgi:hypothetical protein
MNHWDQQYEFYCRDYLYVNMTTNFVWNIAFVWSFGIVATIQVLEFATYMTNPKQRESKYYTPRINSILIKSSFIKAPAVHVTQIYSFSDKYYCAVRSRSVNVVHKLSILIDRLSYIPIRTVIFSCEVGHSWQRSEENQCVNVEGRHFEHSNCP